jgi:hypothetical protein
MVCPRSVARFTRGDCLQLLAGELGALPIRALTTVESTRGKLEAIPLDDVKRILEQYGALNQDRGLSPGRSRRP